MRPLRPAAFYLDEAARLRRLATDCSNGTLRFELLARAGELEELAAWSNDAQDKPALRQSIDQLTATSKR